MLCKYLLFPSEEAGLTSSRVGGFGDKNKKGQRWIQHTLSLGRVMACELPLYTGQLCLQHYLG